MKQPEAPRQTLVWTPDMDPRQQQKAAPEVQVDSAAPAPIRVSAPAAPVSPPASAKVKKIKPIPTAEIPPTRLQISETPAVEPAAQVAPAPRPLPTKEVLEENQPVIPAKPSSPKAAKARKAAEAAAFANEHGISHEYARLVLDGTWTLQSAQHRSRQAAINKERALIRQGAVLQSEKILSRWIEEKTPLVRVTDEGTSSGVYLLQIERLALHWDDHSEPLPKIQSYLIYSQTDGQTWAHTWKTDPELQGQTIPRRFADRVLIPNWEMEKVMQRRRLCTVKFYNGLELTGYVVSWHDYALEMVSSLEETEAARVYVFRHAIYEFSILPGEPKTEASAQPSTVEPTSESSDT